MINNRLPFYYNNINYQKEYEKTKLRKISNGLGFFVFSYMMLMQISVVLITLILFTVLGDGSGLDNSHSVSMYLLEIFTAAFSAFIPSLFYFLMSKNNISETIKVKYVKQNILWPSIFIGMAVAMLANYASDIVVTNFSLFGLENTINFDNSSSTVFENILYIISTAVVPAFAEEFAFRGVLMGSLRKYGDAFAIIVSSVMFGAMHGNITQIPFAFILGLIFALIDCKTNSIIPSIIIHFINNLYAVLLDIINSNSALDENILNIIYLGLIFLFCILGIISFIYLTRKDKNFFKITDEAATEKNLSLKEKNKTFFQSVGVILSLSIFLLETIMYLGVFDVNM